MSVYVDDMKASYRPTHIRGLVTAVWTMCHMIADSEAELHAMADAIGVKRKWFQGDHYDITWTKRRLAVRRGAIEITWREAGRVMSARRRGEQATVTVPAKPEPPADPQGALSL